MELEIRPMSESENKYTFARNVASVYDGGLIGRLSAVIDKQGVFLSTWDDCHKELKSQIFKDEFDELINHFRENGKFLQNLNTLATFCYSSPQYKMPNEDDYYGIRIDSGCYTYLMRINPNKGEYNIYCYCYRRDLLDRSIRLTAFDFWKSDKVGYYLKDTNGHKIDCKFCNNTTSENEVSLMPIGICSVPHMSFSFRSGGEKLSGIIGYQYNDGKKENEVIYFYAPNYCPECGRKLSGKGDCR